MRGRKPQIGYRQRGGGGYFFTKDGRPIALAMGPDDAPTGPTYLKAFDAWSKIHRQEASKGSDGYAVSALFNRRREFLTDAGKTASLNNFTHFVRSFSDRYGTLPCADIVPHHVRTWLAEATTWGPNSRRLAQKLLSGVFTWGIKEGLIEKNPIRGRMEMAKEHVKGRDARLSAKLADLIIGEASEDFALFLTMLRRTGARPEEIEHVTADHLDHKDGCIVFPWKVGPGEYQHKQARKGKEVERVIHMPATLFAVCVEQAKKFPKGPIFRTCWNKQYATDNRSASLRKILKKPVVKAQLEAEKIGAKAVTCYSYRATWITERVEEGISFPIIAEMCGNSAAIIERYYSRPDRAKIRTLWHRFCGE